MDEKTEKKPGVQNPSSVTISTCAFLLCTCWLALLIVDRLLPKGFASVAGSIPSFITLLLAAAAGAFAVIKYRGRLYQILTAKVFAVTILIWLLGFTILGTLIVQTASPEELTEVYGAKWSNIIFRSGLNDLFHSLWFGGFLILLALSPILVVIKRRSWRLREWGNLLSHLGVVVILLGGFLGYFYGFKGLMGLHAGESANQVIETRMGIQTGKVQELNFSIGLEDFQVEHYKPEYKIYLYSIKGDSFRPKKSYELKKLEKWTAIESSKMKFKVARVYPDYYLESELSESASPDARPGIQVEIADGPAKRTEILWAGIPGRDALKMPDGSQLRFIWETPSEKELPGFSAARPEEHIVGFEKADCCPHQELAVTPGGEYSLGPGGVYKLKVLQHLPNFVYDLKSRKPSTRSSEPNNPALRVEVIETATGASQERWLFAAHPEFGKTHGSQEGGFELTYKYRAAQQPPAKQILLEGKGREAIELEEGKIAKRFALPSDRQPIPGTNISSFKIFASAKEIKKPATRSDQWKNPLLELEFQRGEAVQSQLLAASSKQPFILPDGKLALRLQANTQEVKAFRSKLAVLQDGRKVMEKIVAVNNPLYYGGYSFYQSKYDQDDPTFSGLLVTSDPGLFLVWIGFVMICLGLIFIYYLKPALVARKSGSN